MKPTIEHQPLYQSAVAQAAQPLSAAPQALRVWLRACALPPPSERRARCAWPFASPEPDSGEVVVFGPNVMKGYHNRPEENQRALTPDGGLRTGDLGRIDAGGYLYITGRIKEQYKLENGKYVMPSPLEEQLKLSPYIANAMLFGENRPYNVAVVVPELQAVHRWAEQSGLPPPADLAQSHAVRTLLQGEIERVSSKFRSFERPQEFVLAREDFTIENGLLTPTLKLKRGKVLEQYRSDLEALYSGPVVSARGTVFARP